MKKNILSVLAILLLGKLFGQGSLIINYDFTVKDTAKLINRTFKFELTDNGSFSIFKPLSVNASSNLFFQKEKNSAIYSASISGKKFLIKEENFQDLIQWTLMDSSVDVLELHCKMAFGKFRGRIYYAFYTDSLPFSAAPWKFFGLPGSVLKIHCSEMKYIYEATSIRTSSHIAKIDNPHSNAQNSILTYEQYYRKLIQKLDETQRNLNSLEKEKDFSYIVKGTIMEIIE